MIWPCLLVIMAWRVRAQFEDTVLEQSLPDQRPPPVQETDYVQQFIDDLLDGKAPDLLDPDNLGGATTTPPEPAFDVYSLVNSSSYWSTDDLVADGSIRDEAAAKHWLAGYLTEAQQLMSLATDAGWHYFTSISDANRRALVDAETVLSELLAATAKQAKQFDIASIQDESAQRQMVMIAYEGETVLSDGEQQELSAAKATLAHAFTNAAVCHRNRQPPCTLRYNDLNRIMATSRQPGELLYMWLNWRKALGADAKVAYLRFVELSNTAARLNGFIDQGEVWRSAYEMTQPAVGRPKHMHLDRVLDGIYTQLRPLYEQLHAYVRRRLAEMYPSQEVPGLTTGGPIPAHLLGSVNGDSWLPLYADTIPFPDVDSTADTAASPWAVDPITEALQRQNLTGENLFRKSGQFFGDIGFSALPDSFWTSSVFVRQWDADMLCYPWTAFDFRNSTDYRVKACAGQASLANLVEAHRLLTQSHYQHEYRHQPLPFREAANPSLSPALADVVAAAVQQPHYLHSLGIGTGEPEPTSTQINNLYSEALDTVVSAPYQMIGDFWRWQLLNGSYSADDANEQWWSLSERYLGVTSVGEADSGGFDALASERVAQQHYPASRHIIANVMHWQIYKALCQLAGYHADWTRECRLDSSKAVGQKLRAVMRLGSSVDWPQALQILTGVDELDATALLEHYAPLQRWLTDYNTQHQSHVGWDGPRTPFDSSVYVPPPAQPLDNGLDSGIVGGVDQALLPTFTRDAVAFVGWSSVKPDSSESCTSPSRECLQDSVCNGTHCDCPEHMAQYGMYCLPQNGVNHGQHDFQLSVQKVEQAESSTTPPDPTAGSSQQQPTLSLLIAPVIVAINVVFR